MHLHISPLISIGLVVLDSHLVLELVSGLCNLNQSEL